MLLSQFTWQGSIGKKRALHVSDGTGRGSIGKKSLIWHKWSVVRFASTNISVLHNWTFFSRNCNWEQTKWMKKQARNGPNFYKCKLCRQKFENLDTISETRSWFSYFAFSVCRKDAQQASPYNFQYDYSMNIKDVGMWNKVNWM